VPLAQDGDQVAIAVALADKLDTLVGFWAINEKPTGSGDPYQLRRAALGVIRILIENDLRVPLSQVLGSSVQQYLKQENIFVREGVESWAEGGIDLDATLPLAWNAFHAARLNEFFSDRLKVLLREQGKRYDLIDAVFALPGQDDLALIVKRVEALTGFLETDDGENLLAGAKRAANILKIEEKKDKTTFSGEPSGSLLNEPAERALAAAIAKVKFDTQAAINVENFDGAMHALAELRAPVDDFFDHVTVNTDDKKLRENRLKLLAQIRDATLTVADFSKIAG